MFGLFDPTTGNLYGITQFGGSAGLGTVFEIPAGTHNVVTLATFNNNNGQQPLPDLAIDSVGDIYGVTRAGVGYGDVFEIVHGTNALVSLYAFEPPYGDFPESGVIIDSNGNLFGAANRGGPLGLVDGGGVVYEIPAAAPPTVAMTAPLPASVEGSDPTLSANATANSLNSSIASVRFQVSSDGGVTWTNAGPAQTAAPYSVTDPLAVGSYLAQAIAIDSSGIAATSAPVAFVVDQPPQFIGGSSLSVAIPEGTAEVVDVAVTDPDSALRYSIAGGDDASKFQIDSSTGELTFLAAPSFNDPTDADGNNVYDVIVQASDGPLSASQTIAVQVNDVTGYGSIYANASWSGLPLGALIADADPTVAGNQPAVFGVSAFSSITAALDAMSTSGTILVNAGTYAESPTLIATETLQLLGNVTVNSMTSYGGTTVDLQGNTLTIGDAVDAGSIAGLIKGSGDLVKVGSDTLTLGGTDTYSGPTAISAGSVVVSGSLASSTISVSAGSLIVNGSLSTSSTVSITGNGVLGGTGTVGNVTNSGIVNPGPTGAAGILNVAGNLTLHPGTLVLDLAAAGSDSINIPNLTSTVDVTGTTLSLNVATITPGESFTILNVPGTTPVTGFFNGLTGDNSTMTVGSLTFTINYHGGDGNDVTLTASGTIPTLVNGSPTLNGNGGGWVNITTAGIVTNTFVPGYIESTAAAKQHSMVESVVYSFAQGVSLTTANFSLTGLPGSGTTSAPNVVLTPNSDNTVWTVTFSGAGVNTATHSIGDGEYQLILSGLPGLSNNTYNFYRLLGDIDGSGGVDSGDLLTLNGMFLRSPTDPGYLGAMDFDGSNTIDSADLLQFDGNFLHSVPLMSNGKLPN